MSYSIKTYPHLKVLTKTSNMLLHPKLDRWYPNKTIIRRMLQRETALPFPYCVNSASTFIFRAVLPSLSLSKDGKIPEIFGLRL